MLQLAPLLLHLILTGCSGETPEAFSPTPGPSVPTPAASAPENSPIDPALETAPTTTPAELAADAVLLEEVKIKDPARGQRVAFRLLVPKSWKVEGGLTVVGPAYHMIPTMSDVTVLAPDGRGARFWGMLEYGWADGLVGQLGMPLEGRPACPIPRSPGEHWRRMFDNFPAEGVTGLEVVSEKVQRDATKQLRILLAPLYESTRQENAQLRSIGQSMEFDVDVRRLVSRYRDQGRPTEATIFAALRKTIYRHPDHSIRAAMWNLDYMYAVFGP